MSVNNDCRASFSAHTYLKYDTVLVGFPQSHQSSVGGLQREVQCFIQRRTDNFLRAKVKQTKEMIVDF